MISIHKFIFVFIMPLIILLQFYGKSPEVEASLPARTEDPNLQITSCSLRLEIDYENMNFREDGSIDWEACRDDCILSCVDNFNLVNNVASHRCGLEEDHWDSAEDENRQFAQMILNAKGLISGEDKKEEEETYVTYICCCGSKIESASPTAAPAPAP